jgi:hypothetical protein
MCGIMWVPAQNGIFKVSMRSTRHLQRLTQFIRMLLLQVLCLALVALAFCAAHGE